MADEIKVHCSFCGNYIASITYAPGLQYIGCPKCKGVSLVIIKNNGQYEIKQSVTPPSK